MKKTILLFFVIIAITSCTENDSNLDTTVSDPIIGEWQLQSIIENGVNVDLTECEKKSTLKFNEDGSSKAISYDGIVANNCYKDDEENSTWKNNGDGTYTLDEYSDKVTFSENNTVLTIVASDSDTGEKIILIFKKK